MKAIILAGGQGTRLRPLTYKIPKALIPIQGKTLTEQVFDIYQKAGVTDIYLSVAYLAQQMQDYFGDGSKFGFNISYLKEPEPMGTAGPLLLLRQQGKIPTSDFFMSNGDNLFALDLNEMIRQHQKTGAIATIALTKVSDPTRFGIARLEDSRISEFIEKPTVQEAPSLYASSGYYLLSPAVFDYLPAKNFVMVEKDLWPVLAKAGKLFGYCSDAQWFDTGTPESYEQVEREWRGV
ncbi:MAG: NDP-sugar synthase [Patescibacteria group bacterium]|jgi:NDP-sugar pyrophosphorylase family protein|nr:NDP-sugar synthase [Patescibacteria group bacterium]